MCHLNLVAQLFAQPCEACEALCQSQYLDSVLLQLVLAALRFCLMVRQYLLQVWVC